MDATLNILILEADADNAALVEQELRKADLDFRSKLVETEKDFLKELKNFPPDLILSDYRLSGFDGVSALMLVRQIAPYIPFIMITGFLDEDIAVECLKAGAADYVVKERLHRVGPIVKSALVKKRLFLEKEQFEQELRRREEQYRLLFQKNPLPMWIFDSKTFAFLAVNDSAVRHYGYSEEEFLSMTMADVKFDEEQSPESVTGRSMLGGKHRKKDGTIIDVEITSRSFLFEGKQARLVSANDITKRKRAEEALRESKERLSVTLRSIGDGVIATDADGCVNLMNETAEILTGWTQNSALSKDITEVFCIIDEKTRESCADLVKMVLKTGSALTLPDNALLISKDGNERVIADTIAPIRDKNGKIVGAVIAFHDITEKKRLEEEMLKISKLESLGTLAGGIAHDFNNLLTAVIGNIYLAKKNANPQSVVFQRLADIEKETLMAKGLTNQLLTFSKGGLPIVKTASIGEILMGSALFVVRGTNVTCEFSIQKDLNPVEIDKEQISRVINNVVINAQQAMPEGGSVEIGAENVFVAEADALHLQPGKYVKIFIRDSGGGIPEEHIDKIFDPFFTTKAGGSGLGLAASYSIIKKHNGYITVDSKAGAGTTFYIYLPASSKEIEKENDRRVSKPFSKRKVLLMDDNEMIRDVTGEMLLSLGYEVSLVKEGAEAVQLYRKAKESGSPFDAVILDLTIQGGLSGKDTIKRLLEIDPKVKAVVSSGYSDDPVMANHIRYGFKAVAVKPYMLEELNEALLAAIEG